MEITLGPGTAELLPGRALFLPKSGTLVVADLHLGKSATFRARGLPVPEGSTASDLARLSQLVVETKARHLVIAGDMVHSATGLSTSIISALETWLQDLAIPVTLTEGNHDARAWLSSRKLAFETLPSLQIDGITITHDPADLKTGQAGIAGHLHPGVKIRETARRTLRIAGFFYRGGEHLILPAFSEFTGIHPIPLGPDDRFFAEMSKSVAEIPRALIEKAKPT